MISEICWKRYKKKKTKLKNMYALNKQINKKTD